MTASSAIAGFGAAFSWNSQTVGEITEIGGLKVSAKFIDITNLSSPDGFEEQKPTLLKGENLSIKGNFIASDTNGQQAMLTDFLAKTSRTGVITFPTAITATWTFTGYIANFEITGLSNDGKVEFSAEIAITGKPTLAIGASTGMSNLTGIEENAGGALTFNPTFAIGTYLYAVAVNTASTYIKLTPTAASHTITISNGTSEQTVTSGAQSGEIDLGSAGTVTTITVKVYEAGKTTKTYTIYVSRP